MNAKWHDIIQRWFAGTATDAEAAELQEALKTDAELRALYLDYANLDAALETAAGDASMRRASSPGISVAPKTWKAEKRRSWWIPAAAAAAVAAIFSWFLFGTPRAAKRSDVAVLSREAGAVWAEAAPQLTQLTQSRWLKLRSGAAEVVFSRGARVILEGPAEFRVDSDNSGFLKRGKLHASVPPSAHGFAVLGEKFHARDKGTEFACVVPESGAAEVHVFVGSVTVGNSGAAARDLSAAQAARVDETGVRDIPARPGTFIRGGDFERLIAPAPAAVGETRARNRTALSGHPAALVHFDFEEGLPFQNLARADYVPNVMNCEIAEGAAPGTRALAFQTAESRVRVTVPGEFNSLTLLAWIRADGLQRLQNSLLMGDSEQPGEVHWYLTQTGDLCFAVIGPDRKWRRMEMPRVIRPQNPGAWHFLAVTIEWAAVTLYVDGKAVGSESFSGAGPIKLGTFEIGNWGWRPGMPLSASAQHVTSPSFYQRAFEGRIDEFAILSTALSAEEISRLHENRRPTPTR